MSDETSSPLPAPQPLESPATETVDSTAATTPSPWKMPKEQAAFLLMFAFTVALICSLRFFQIDTLQVEIYGDIDIVLGYMREIFDNQWPTHFVLSAGPLYHYIAAPIMYVVGENYTGAKIASVIVSLLGLAATYAVSRKLVNDYFALMTLFIAGVSSWLMIFSRLGNSQIALPLLTMLTLWLVVRVVQSGNQSDVILCAVVSSLGLFVYPQSFIQPGVIFATLLCLSWAKQSLPKRWYITFIVACIPAGLLFLHIFTADPSNFNTYIGNKLHVDNGTSPLIVIGGNIVKTALALHVRGDEGFRSNPETVPHLDVLSGILFIAGIIFWTTTKEKRRWIPLWLVPLVLLQIPSILVINQPAEVPSASRTLGVAPIVYLLVASGLWWLGQFLYKRTKRWLAIVVVGLLLTGILVLNTQRYFQSYITGLPYNNTAVAELVADYANMLPSNTHVYMVGCCWAYGVPDDFVHYNMTHPENLTYLQRDGVSCGYLQTVPSPAVFIWSFNDEMPAPQLSLCKDWLQPQLYNDHNSPIFNAAFLHAGKLDPSAQLEDLAHGTVPINGEETAMDYSPIDMGSLSDLFDGNPDSLIRGNGINPMIMLLHFTHPHKISTVDLTVGSMTHFKVTVTVTYTDNTSKDVENDYESLPDDPHVTIALPESDMQAISLMVSITDLNPTVADAEHIHVRELQIK